MLLYELLNESLGRGGWFNVNTNEYHDLFFDVLGQTHDEFIGKHPHLFGNNTFDVYDNGWVKITYPETSWRSKDESPWIGVEGVLSFIKKPSFKHFLIDFIKTYAPNDLSKVDFSILVF